MIKGLAIAAALCIGLAGYSAAQKYWQSAMMERVNEVSGRDLLPEPTLVLPKVDPDKMIQAINPPMGPMPAVRRH